MARKAKSHDEDEQETEKISKDAFFAKFAAKTKGEILGQMEGVSYFVDTGSLSLNYVNSGKFIKGGIPGGRISEVFGPNSSAKSLFGTNILFGAQKIGGYAIILDCENAVNPEWTKKSSHLDIDKVVRYTPKTLEEAFLKIYNVIKAIREYDKKAPIVIVWDSIAVCPSAREYREIELPDNYTDAQFKSIVKSKEQPGERAKICSREFRKLNAMAEANEATLLIINQIRDKIGVMFGSPETTAGGGNALPFYASLRFRTQTQKRIFNKKLGTVVGINVKIKNAKNRFRSPFAEVENLQLFFHRGINPIGGLLSTLLQAERIERATGKGMYAVLPEFLPTGKEEYTFQSNKDRNDVPISLLLDCPKLIDAVTREEVEEYLLPFGDIEALEEETEEEEDEDDENES